MSKRTISDTSKVAEDAQPFQSQDEDDVVAFDEDFFKHARIRRGNVVIREATGRLTGEGIVPYPKAGEE